MAQDKSKLLLEAVFALEKAKKEIEKRNLQLDEDRKNLVTGIGKDIVSVLHPLLEKVGESAKLNREEIKRAISESKIQVDVQSQSPVVNIPDINVPEPKVTVNIPTIKVPEIRMPDEMDIRGWVQLQGVNLDNPLPVQLRDKDGKPVNLIENMTQVFQGGGGGFRIMEISDIRSSTDSLISQTENAIRVLSVGGVSGLSDTELRASHLDVQQLSGSVDSVVVNNILSPIAQGDSATALRVVVAGDSAVSVTTANSLLVDQLSGAAWSVYANNPVNQGDAATALRVVVAGNSDVSVTATQTGTWTVSLSGSLASAVVVGPTVGGIADDGSAPLKDGGIARTTNPTKVSDGQIVASSHDAVGRQLVRPVQARGLLQTAYLSLTTGTEATLLAGSASTFFDLIYVMGTNSSDAAVTVDLRAATAAGIQTSIRIPANGTAGVSMTPPLPQDTAADTWTADMPDITGTTVTLSALFSKEV